MMVEPIPCSMTRGEDLENRRMYSQPAISPAVVSAVPKTNRCWVVPVLINYLFRRPPVSVFLNFH